MTQRDGPLLLACFEVPGWGGLTTATYRLFETLLADGFDVHYVSLVPQESVARFEALLGPRCTNPRGLPNVAACELIGPLHEPHPEVARAVDAIDPRLVLGVGDIATFLVKRACPERRLTFLTSGSQQVGRDAPFLEQAAAWNGAAERPPLRDWKEREAMAAADAVLTHSDMTRAIYRRFYPEHAAKLSDEVIWFAEWICAEAAGHAAMRRPFAERDVGVLFVASTWSRKEKNYPFVQALVPRLAGLAVHVVGEVPERVAGATFHGPIGDRAALFDLMGRARAVASPSLFDAAPGVLFEGSAMGCNAVASRNCGNWELCNEALVVEPFTVDAFASRLALAQERPFPDHLARFLERGSYRRLVRLLLDG